MRGCAEAKPRSNPFDDGRRRLLPEPWGDLRRLAPDRRGRRVRGRAGQPCVVMAHGLGGPRTRDCSRSLRRSPGRPRRVALRLPLLRGVDRGASPARLARPPSRGLRGRRRVRPRPCWRRSRADHALGDLLVGRPRRLRGRRRPANRRCDLPDAGPRRRRTLGRSAVRRPRPAARVTLVGHQGCAADAPRRSAAHAPTVGRPASWRR